VAFLKSVLAGILAVIGAIAVAALGAAVYLWWLAHKYPDSFGLGYVGFAVSPIFLCVLVLIFAAGFWWQWRRAR
jgi:hypothetical protein